MVAIIWHDNTVETYYVRDYASFKGAEPLLLKRAQRGTEWYNYVLYLDNDPLELDYKPFSFKTLEEARIFLDSSDKHILIEEAIKKIREKQHKRDSFASISQFI